MSKLIQRFSEYAQYHGSPGNQRMHLLGIPMIVVSVLAWAGHWVWVPALGSATGPLALIQFDAGVLLVLLTSLWYVFLDWRIGLPFALILCAAYWVGRVLPGFWIWALFIGGWVLQLVGHGVFEKKSPAFLKNLEHLLIGPIWVFAKLFQCLP